MIVIIIKTHRDRLLRCDGLGGWFDRPDPFRLNRLNCSSDIPSELLYPVEATRTTHNPLIFP